MPTVDRIEGFILRINTHDHGFPHVHVIRGEAMAKIRVDVPNGEVLANHGLTVHHMEEGPWRMIP